MTSVPDRLVVPEPGGEPRAELPVREASLVERYRGVAHTFEPRPADRVLRVVDIVLSALLLALLAPVIALSAAAVLASGGRPVLYRGARVGRAGRVFDMYKLRTLRVDAEQRLGPYLGEELSRLTAQELTVAGRVLRATKLDELPQLWNVLRGDMSLVGPRPIRPAFFVELCEAIPAYWQRLVVRPGMTGLAQLRLPREMTWAEKLAHDIEFIADRSLRLYVSVLWQTLVVLVRRALGRGGAA
jgi:lipopolysaccharide/colanic/teichoic acid biosynthesis glycosyltransferase